MSKAINFAKGQSIFSGEGGRSKQLPSVGGVDFFLEQEQP